VTNEYISGKKTILFPMKVQDIDFFVGLYKDNESNLGIFPRGLSESEIREMVENYLKSNTISIWTAFTKMGKASRKMGCIFLTDITEFSGNMHGFLDKHYLKDLVKQMEVKYTYSEDCCNTLINYCFKNMHMERLSALVHRDNTLSYRLCRKVGFKVDGVLRRAIKDGDKFKDIVIMSILKEDRLNSNSVKNDTEEKPIGKEL